MDCVMSSQNAFIVDRILQAVRTSAMLIDTTNEVAFQLIAADKTLILNLTLEKAFFTSLSLKNRLALIPRQKFYIKKMKLLRITTNEYVMVFEYVFDKYVLRRRVFYNQSQPFAIDFKIDLSGEINPNVLRLALKEIGEEIVTLRVAKDVGEIRGEETRMRFAVELHGEFSVDVIGGNLRSIFEVSDLFIRMGISYGSSNLSINFVFVGSGTKASFFVAINRRANP
ncbi:hypothetical protein [Encephalitozoon cuniculi GB-M1]|uniref:Proliferating cell nuclear antigen n=1 Tax=Encephalitozoon cuniculi (strain GB-M1) TaxID=284813 RepID=Q8SUT5_ENCCU|nr:uncharacterized protein ECU08_0200 [Encephalitozoon cuniculi GB-M1]CAD26326.1 hypothetical protein [Encephalitozoon cuniculi GB-M1]